MKLEAELRREKEELGLEAGKSDANIILVSPAGTIIDNTSAWGRRVILV